MRTTLDIDDDLLNAARRLAADRNSTIGRVISQLARRGLRAPPLQNTNDSHFPVFDVPDDAPALTSDMVNRAFDDAWVS
ncbi:MAG: antitoxin [Gammaproteobacteria bacterium]